MNYAGCHAANWQGWRRSKALLHNTLVSGVRRLHMCAACDSFTSTSLEVPSNLLWLFLFFFAYVKCCTLGAQLLSTDPKVLCYLLPPSSFFFPSGVIICIWRDQLYSSSQCFLWCNCQELFSELLFFTCNCPPPRTNCLCGMVVTGKENLAIFFVVDLSINVIVAAL